jgi:hypothetical protein
VKLLLDENLSPQLIDLLSDLYPGSAHRVETAQRKSSPDIWKQIDESMDGFIDPIMHAERKNSLEADGRGSSFRPGPG